MQQEAYLFEEKQQFRQLGLWALLAVTLLPITGVLIYQMITGREVGNNPAPNIVLVLLSLFVVLPVLLGFYFARLTTRISGEGIFFGFNFPFGELNKISWAEVQECKVIRYGFVGLGYHLSATYGTVYNIKGNKGLHIVKKDGSQFLIGTGRPDELRAVLAGYMRQDGTIIPEVP